jgi:uncharacterized membrane protein
MTGWGEFGAAFACFLLSHMIPVRPPVRPWLVARLRLTGYILAYSVLSIGILIWLFGAAARAPYVAVLPDWPVLRIVPLATMPVVCWLVVAGMASTNPLSFGGLGKGEFDASSPGILRFSRHPLPLALILWALAHLLANGDLAHVILFGVFALFAAASLPMIDRRKSRALGDSNWRNLAHNTSWFRPSEIRVKLRDFIFAAIAYAALLMLHPSIIGVAPWP